MAQVRVPANVSSVTLATSGVLAPSSQIITCTALEATALCKAEQWGPGNQPVAFTNASTGATDIIVPSIITSITINGNVYAVTNNKISAVPAADAVAFMFNLSFKLHVFHLVTG